jgi:hypothetical protein
MKTQNKNTKPMKKLLLVFLFFTGLVNAQIVNIPDANFKAKLLSANSSNQIAGICNSQPCLYGTTAVTHITIDINGDNEIQVSECQAVEFLNINSSNISDLTGIEQFTNLKSLFCSNNNLINVNISALSNLNEFRCENNQLSNLNVSGCLNLNYLWIENNQLATIDISNLTNLLHLYCANNQLSILDVSNLQNLEVLYCQSNNLINLDLSQNTSLWALWCYSNQINYLNLKEGNPADNFAEFFIQNNPLQFVCVDLIEINFVQQQINLLGLSNTCSVSTYCTFTPGGNFNTITGSIIYDVNLNGCDALDLPQNNIRIDINNGTNQGASFTNNNGNYFFYTDAGSFDINPNLENPTWFTISPNTTTIPFADNNNNVTSQNFCVSPNGIHNDVEVVIIPVGVARPGFDTHYKIVYKNKGNQTLSGNITVTYNDATLDYVSASILPNNQSTGSISWNYSNLLPFENRSIDVTLNVNSPTETPAVNNGDILNYSITINPTTGDESPNDNIFQYNQTVVGSYDPNSVECLEGETVSPSLIGEYLHYAINFENLGTYQAENVVVKDIIDTSKFDVNTLQMLNTSHEVYTKLTGNDIEFIFEGINLAAASGNPPVGGHGTILFKIKSKPNLVTNDFVTKTADIYFDYNFPIATNIETTTFAALSNSIFTIDESVVVAPNPTNGIVNIESKNNIKSIELYDVQGRILQTIVENNITSKIDISTKENGIYFLKINTDYGSKAVKIMKK